MPNTLYQYQMIGLRNTEGGQIQTALANASAKTPLAGPPPPPPPPPAPRVTNVQAIAKPFGRIVVTWETNANKFSTLFISRFQVVGQTGGGTGVRLQVSAGTEFTDVGLLFGAPLIASAVYEYDIDTNFGGVIHSIMSNKVIYPQWFSLKQFLPAGFDPSQGIKRLRPNDHPFVSVRKIITG